MPFQGTLNENKAFMFQFIISDQIYPFSANFRYYIRFPVTVTLLIISGPFHEKTHLLAYINWSFFNKLFQTRKSQI